MFNHHANTMKAPVLQRHLADRVYILHYNSLKKPERDSFTEWVWVVITIVTTREQIQGYLCISKVQLKGCKTTQISSFQDTTSRKKCVAFTKGKKKHKPDGFWFTKWIITLILNQKFCHFVMLLLDLTLCRPHELHCLKSQNELHIKMVRQLRINYVTADVFVDSNDLVWHVQHSFS